MPSPSRAIGVRTLSIKASRVIKRMRMCGLLKWLAWRYPELRLGQILSHALRLTEGHGTLFYMSDDILLEYLIQYRKDLRTHGRRENLRRRILRWLRG
jgi:hypothetical protein